MTTLEKLARRLKAADDNCSADENGDGQISPKELHRHFDDDRDGKVDMKDYAKHIALHTAHPEWLAKETAQVVAEQEGIPEKSAVQKLAARLKNPEGGLTAAGRRHYAKTEGAKLKPGVKNPDEAGDSEKKRWARWAVRFYSNPRGPMTNDKGEPTRLALMANAWGTKVPKTREEAQAIAARGRKILESAREKKSGEGHLDKNDPDIYITEDGRRTRRGLWANVALKKKREKRSAYEEGVEQARTSLGL